MENQWAILWPTPFFGAFPLTRALSLGEREISTTAQMMSNESSLWDAPCSYPKCSCAKILRHPGHLISDFGINYHEYVF